MTVIEEWGEYRGFRYLISLIVSSEPDVSPSWYCAYVSVPLTAVRNATKLSVHRGFTYGTWFESDEHPWMMKWPNGSDADRNCAVVGWDYSWPEDLGLVSDVDVRKDIIDYLDRVIETMGS